MDIIDDCLYCSLCLLFHSLVRYFSLPSTYVCSPSTYNSPIYFQFTIYFQFSVYFQFSTVFEPITFMHQSCILSIFQLVSACYVFV